MGCPIQTKETTGLILDYCARHLGPEQAAALEAHARVCSSCREMIEAQRVVWRALDEWEPSPVSGHFDRKLYARIEEERSSGAFMKWSRCVAARWPLLSWRAPAAVAAACAAVVLAVVIAMPGTPPDTRPAEPHARMEHVDIEQVERTLDDMNMLKQFAPLLQASDQTSSSM